MKESAPLIMVSANLAWNLVNFREGLIRALIAKGYRVLAVAPPDPAMEARLSAMGCSFAPLQIDAKGLSPLRDLKALWGYYRLLRRHRPAAFLGWTIKPNVYGSLAAGWLGIAALPNVSGLGTAFIRDNLLTRLVKALYRAGFHRAPVVFFQNGDDRDLFLAARLVRIAQAQLLPGSGIDTAHWSPPPGGRPPRGHFLMIARVVADKGVREYAEAARALKARWPDARFRLLGPLDAANRTAIAATEVRAWEAQGLIEHLPPRDDPRDLIAAADFVVLPSYREGLSRVLLEAAAMARPAIASDVPGCRDVVRDGINGYLCAPRDAAALAEAMERALRTTDAEWERMGQAGRDRVMADFTPDKVTGLYLDALNAAGAGAKLRS